MRLLFGVLSATASSAALEQICAAAGPSHRVVVHHDFSKESNFALYAPNAYVIQDAVQTDWGGWGQVEAILKTLQTAVDRFEFDYFQLLSESCLPIRPIAEFEAYLRRSQPDVCAETLRLDDSDCVAMVNYAYRYYPRNRLEKTAMRRLGQLALGPRGSRQRLELGGLALERPSDGRLKPTWVFALAKLVENAKKRSALDGQPIYCGSTWFCASSEMVRRMLGYCREEPEFVAYFLKAQNADEGFLPTLVMRAEPRRIAPFNHFIRWTQRWTGPDELTEHDIPALVASAHYFARKFPSDPASAVRRRALAPKGSRS